MWDLFISIFVNVLIWIYDVVGHNFGLAIILFTILIRIVTWPLNAQQLKGAAAMQELQNDKDWQAIQKKYAKDREKLAQEQMRVYREKGINPFGSCLPTLIQFPIIIALYQSIIRALASSPLDLLKLLIASGGLRADSSAYFGEVIANAHRTPVHHSQSECLCGPAVQLGHE